MSSRRVDVEAPTVLRAGLHPVQRDRHTLQVGLDPPRRVLLPDVPEVRALLRALAPRWGGVVAAPAEGPAAHAWRALRAIDALVPLTAEHPLREVALHQFGSTGPERLRRRSRTRVRVTGPAWLTARLCTALNAAGLDPAAGDGADGADDVDLVLATAHGHLARDDIDELTRASTRHLLLETAPGGGWRVGPFVEPGRTACLRCLDAAAGSDPRRALVLGQLVDVEPQAPTPLDPILTDLALAWAVRDLARAAEGERPSTWSATVDVEATGAPTVRPWARHPHCGCSWADDLATLAW